MDFIFSDTHFGHHNICGPEGFVESRRVFKEVGEMNQTIIRNFNKAVGSRDRTYHLGDVAMNMIPAEVFDVLKELNGQIVIIKGNHDNSNFLKYILRNNFKIEEDVDKFIVHEVGTIVKANKKVYYLTHYPLGLGENRKNMRNFCGHIHDVVAREKNVLNVAIDSLELPSELPFGEPISFELACKLVEEKYEGAGED